MLRRQADAGWIGWIDSLGAADLFAGGEPDVSQGKIVPLIAASEARERVHVEELAAEVRELRRRVDELTDDLHAYIGDMRRRDGGTP